jgi:hypothetical protein
MRSMRAITLRTTRILKPRYRTSGPRKFKGRHSGMSRRAIVVASKRYDQ